MFSTVCNCNKKFQLDLDPALPAARPAAVNHDKTLLVGLDFLTGRIRDGILFSILFSDLLQFKSEIRANPRFGNPCFGRIPPLLKNHDIVMYFYLI